MEKKNILIFILIIFLTAGLWFTATQLSVFQNNDPEVKVLMQARTLEYWRVYDGPDVFKPMIDHYNAVHPYITIKYKKLRYDEYEQELLEAFATDRGPDIFSIHNTWIGKYKSKELITPLPSQITMAYPVTKGAIKKEIVPELRTVKSVNSRDIENKFVDVVYDDVVYREQDVDTKQVTYDIYGLPLFVDTLAMYYNKDLLNNAGITSPSTYWNRKFQQDVKKLTKQDVKGNIIQSGVALGGSDNIERFSDILSVLMMQNGTEMIDDNGRVMFHTIPESFRDKSYNPGLEAVRFYTDFANPGKEVFSWNSEIDNSIDMFADGKLAMLFAYSYHLPVIKAKNPKLNFNISKLPQIEGNEENVNFANYWVEVVSSKGENKDAAWDFVQFITKEEQAKIYLEKTNKPTALRALVSGQLDDLDLGIFVDQVLTAKSWYRGNNAVAAEAYIGEVIESVGSGQEDILDILGLASKKIQQTITE
jgi:multiple sugar transport system substrate-binding protein